jgi:hypothetical protein
MSISNQKGDIGEAAFLLAATKKGYWTGKMPQDCPYDFVLDKKDGSIHRVQVKYRSIGKTGTITLKLTQNTFTNRVSYTKNNIDFFAVYVPDLDNVYLVPITDLDGKTEVHIRCVQSKNNQNDKVRNISDYECW